MNEFFITLQFYWTIHWAILGNFRRTFSDLMFAKHKMRVWKVWKIKVDPEKMLLNIQWMSSSYDHTFIELFIELWRRKFALTSWKKTCEKLITSSFSGTIFHERITKPIAGFCTFCAWYLHLEWFAVCRAGIC